PEMICRRRPNHTQRPQNRSKTSYSRCPPLCCDPSRVLLDPRTSPSVACRTRFLRLIRLSFGPSVLLLLRAHPVNDSEESPQGERADAPSPPESSSADEPAPSSESVAAQPASDRPAIT